MFVRLFFELPIEFGNHIGFGIVNADGLFSDDVAFANRASNLEPPLSGCLDSPQVRGQTCPLE